MSLRTVPSCSSLPEDSLLQCDNCGWKCDCQVCSLASSYTNRLRCRCRCRTQVVFCSLVLLGFFVVFLVSLRFRRTLVAAMATLAMALVVAFGVVAAVTDECNWPAFLSASLVFVFPCAYSYARKIDWPSSRNRSQVRTATAVGSLTAVGEPTAGGPPGRASNQSHEGARVRLGTLKPAGAVLMLFPGGDVMLGVENQDEQRMSGSGMVVGGTDSCAARILEEGRGEVLVRRRVVEEEEEEEEEDGRSLLGQSELELEANRTNLT